MATQSNINEFDKNITIPFFPSESWELTATNVISDPADITYQTLPYFNYIQAFFDATSVTAPILAIFSGKYHADGSPVVSPVRFAFSGERVNIKGQLILDSGTDILGNTITSTPVGTSGTTDITGCYAYGGTQ